MPELTDFKVLTFDCYGTLIDWETGIWNALQPLLSAGRHAIGREEALAAFARRETEQELATPSLLYSTLLAVTHARLAQEWGIAVHADLHERFGASVPDWPAFPDSAPALAYLKRHYRLVVLSNVDRRSFAASNTKLGGLFDAVYTAEDVGSYKPDPRNFSYLLEHLSLQFGLEAADVLHTAQSLHHDHLPASRIGLARAWIDRRGGRQGGATLLVDGVPAPDFHFHSLAALAEAHRKNFAG